MAEFDCREMPPENPDPTAPPEYYMTEPPPYSQPQPQPQPNYQHTTYVITQQPAPTTVTQVIAVPDHMGLAIFTCLCCFCPLGFAAIVMAYQSKSALERGDVNGARSNSRTSRTLSLIAIGIGVLSIIISIIVSVTSARVTYYSYNSCTGSGCDRG